MTHATKPATKGRYHHGDLQAALVDGALTQLARTGLAGFSVARLAKQIGVSAAAPYRHFADRDELLAAAAIRSTVALTEAMEHDVRAAGDDPAARLAATAGTYARFVLQHGVGFEFTYAPMFRPRRFAALHDRGRQLMDLLLSLVDAAAPGLDRDATLALLEAHLAVAEGYAALQRRGAPSLADLPAEQVGERATRAALVLLGGTREPGA